MCAGAEPAARADRRLVSPLPLGRGRRTGDAQRPDDRLSLRMNTFAVEVRACLGLLRQDTDSPVSRDDFTAWMARPAVQVP
jgi:hypothetical protein